MNAFKELPLPSPMCCVITFFCEFEMFVNVTHPMIIDFKEQKTIKGPDNPTCYQLL